MVFGFGSSSSSSSSSTNSNEPPPAPNREQRAACWKHRDAYFACLTQNGIMKPGDEAKDKDGKDSKPGQGVCVVEREGYEKSCGKSWIDYFNQRRTIEYRQKATQAASGPTKRS